MIWLRLWLWASPEKGVNRKTNVTAGPKDHSAKPRKPKIETLDWSLD